MLYSLRDAPPEITEIGETGVGLCALVARGFPVAPAWVLGASAFDAALERAGVADEVAEIAWSLRGVWNDLDTARRVLDGIEPQRRKAARALRRATLPDELGKVLERLALMRTSWALRFSLAREENGDGDLYAGLFSPLLSVPSGARLWDGIRQAWASALCPEVLLRAAQHDAALPRLAVLLQSMAPVTARDRSGVVTSHSPIPDLTGPVVRAVYGTWQGNGLGSLYAEACGQWVVVPAHSTEPAKALVSGAGGGLELQPYPPGQPLSGDEAGWLADLVEQVAERAGGPARVEFTWPAAGLSACGHAQAGEPLIVQVQTGREE